MTSHINEILLDELKEHTRKYVKEEASEKGRLKVYVLSYLDFIRKNREKFVILAELGINLNQKLQDQLFSSAGFFSAFRLIKLELPAQLFTAQYYR